MKNFIIYYKKSRKQKLMLILEMFGGLALMIYTLIYCCVGKNNVVSYLIGYSVIYLIFSLSKIIVKLYKVYGFNAKIEFSSLLKINNLYNNIVDSGNYEIIKMELSKINNLQKNRIYNYLKDTREFYNLYRVRDVVLMAIGLGLGASFNEKAIITTELLSNGIISSIGFILGILPFYIIFIKIHNSYNKLANANIIKTELIRYFNEYDILL